MNKCELLSLKQCDLPSICGIPIKNEVTYLGIKIVKDEERRCELNFSPVIDKTKKNLNHWLLRGLSLRGRVLITKAEGISRLTYTALSLAVNDNICKTIDNMLFNFLWKNKTHYIKKSVIMNTTENGGLNFLHFTTLNYTFKINWIKQFKKTTTSFGTLFLVVFFHRLEVLVFFCFVTTTFLNYHLNYPVFTNKCFSPGI